MAEEKRNHFSIGMAAVVLLVLTAVLAGRLTPSWQEPLKNKLTVPVSEENSFGCFYG